MIRVVRCDCGHRVVADGTGALVAAARAHARAAHRMELPAELVLVMAEPWGSHAMETELPAHRPVLPGGGSTP